MKHVTLPVLLLAAVPCSVIWDAADRQRRTHRNTHPQRRQPHPSLKSLMAHA